MDSEAVAERTRAALSGSALATLVVAFLFSLVALAELNGLLAGMHVEGDVGHTIGDLASIRHPDEASERAADVVESWRRWQAGYETAIGPDVVSPAQVVVLHAVLDTLLLALTYTIGLFLFFRSIRSPPATAEERTVAYWASYLTLALGAVDLVENGLEIAVLVDGWHDELEEIGIGWPALALTIAAIVKYALALFVVVAAVALGWLRFARWWRGGEGASFRRAAFRLRLHIVVAVFFAGVLLGHEQLPDLVRRWTIVQLGWAILGTALFAWVLWVSAETLLAKGPRTEAAPNDTTPTEGPPPFRYERRGRAALWALYLVCVVVVVGALVDAFDLGLERFPWGLAIPAAVVLAIAAAGKLFAAAAVKDQQPSPPIPETSDGYRLSSILPAAVIVALGLAVFRASFGYTIYLQQWTWWIAFVAVVVFVFGVVGLLVAAGAPADPSSEPLWRQIVRLPLVWAVVGVLVAFAVMRFSVEGELNGSLLVATAVFLGYGGWFTYSVLERFHSYDRRVRLGTIGVGLVLMAVLWLFIVVTPWSTARELGGVAILAGFCLALTLAGWAIVHLSDGVPPPAALRALQLRRTPIVVFLLLWLVLASVIDPGGFHDVRRAADARGQRVMLTEAWECWKQKNAVAPRDSATCSQPPGDDTAEAAAGVAPLVFVASTGGGIRAAFWTSYVLDCALEVEIDRAVGPGACETGPRAPGFRRSDAVFAMSGVSGGSLGLASYAAYLTEKRGPEEGDWQTRRLDDDSLSASVAWWLFVEVPWSFGRFGGAKDRAAVLEQGWERDWGRESDGDGLSQPFLGLWKNPRVPLLFLNGTSVVDGCRFSVSTLDANIESTAAADADALERCRSTEAFDETDDTTASDLSTEHVRAGSALGATRDLVDFLCGGTADIPLSTAALLSGRFPFVSPSGRIEQPCDNHRVSYVVDGGYLETSGASPALQTVTRLEPEILRWNRENPSRCVVPFLIQIDNGAPGRQDLSKRPQELLVPLTSLFQSRIGRAADARNAAGLAFNTPFGTTTFKRRNDAPARALIDRYAHFVNLAHPGPQPPLGWTLSEFSREDIRGQLGQPRNVDAMNEVRSWFIAAADGRLACR